MIFMLIYWEISFICLLIRCIGGLKVSLTLVRPLPYDIFYDTSVNFEVQISLKNGQFLPSHNEKVCATHHIISSQYPVIINAAKHAKDVCSTKNKFTLDGYKSGTNSVSVYLRISELDEEGNVVDYAITGVSRIFQVISMIAPNRSDVVPVSADYELMDTLTVFNLSPGLHSMTPHTEIIGVDHPDSHRSRNVHSWRPKEVKCTHVSFYLKELQYHGANNRLLHWLFDSTRFEDYGYCLSIVTSARNSSHNLELFNKLRNASILIKQYECLSDNSNSSDISTTVSLESLSSFFYDEVHIVIAVNTFLHPLTTVIVDAIANPNIGNLNLRPLLLFDLPNIGIDYPADLFDGLIAPSRFAGFHQKSVNFNKTIAVIYPPACSLKWIEQSPCYSIFTENSDISINHREAKKFVNVSHFSQGVLLPAIAINENVIRGENNKIKFIVPSRLSIEKSPALLFYALDFIRSKLNSEEWRSLEGNMEINFYGDGPLLPFLVEMRNNYNFGSVINFKGLVNEEELISVMRTSHVVVNPILVGETFGFTHTEAGVMGLPVIAFNAGANLESISSGIVLDPYRDSVVEDLAKAIFTMFVEHFDGVSADYRMNKCKDAKRRIAQWSIERHSNSLMDVIQSMLTSETKV